MQVVVRDIRVNAIAQNGFSSLVWQGGMLVWVQKEEVNTCTVSPFCLEEYISIIFN